MGRDGGDGSDEGGLAVASQAVLQQPCHLGVTVGDVPRVWGCQGSHHLRRRIACYMLFFTSWFTYCLKMEGTK